MSSHSSVLFRKSSLCAAIVAVCLSAAGHAGAQSAGPRQAASESYVSGRILVMPRAGLPEAALDKILKDNASGRGRRVGRSELRIVDLPRGLEKQAVEKLSRHPHIEFAELDRLLEPRLVTSDPYLGSQWHLPRIGADVAWDSANGTGVVIAILDSGVDSTHPDLAGKIVPGWNVYDNNSNTADVEGHGTEVAGAAAASFNNGLGVAGVAGAARIMPIRISGTDGWASLSAMATGLTWAADHGARVANISYVASSSSSVNSAASYMKSKGGLVTSSAGNYARDEGIAATTAQIPVSATDGNDNLTSWSSYGNHVALAAPGAGIYTTTRGGGYAAMSGTSYSAPITAGVAALVMSANPRLSSAEVEKLLFSTAIDLGSAGRDVYFGHGRVNAAAAVRAALSTSTTSDTTAPTVSLSSPTASSTVSGLVPVNVSASDNVGVTKVELRVNGAVIGTDVASPFAFSWDSSQVANGTATLTAVAYDGAGNIGTSTAVSVNVSNVAAAPAAPDTTAPTVALRNPVNGATVKGTVTIQGSASDDTGTANLRSTLYINGRVVASGTGGSLTYQWNSNKAGTGTHTIQMVTADAAGNTGSSTVSVKR